ncbi:MAG TPA: SLC13 family permease [Propioniciclava sp.]|jgi:GntP family gluconate:H+ symporter|uniref:GntP family permease n=1 Tax=Propioniciclava sp. TaxID=2038686 RepID=UPI002BBAEB5F|nr:SLC13 family permease [Propioniciclava sp.]HRL50459.1 SLC13 family permease [Propioniciclava sp.]HRL80882.1 SLC13 family permease [Propioniciclava sp.]
MIALHTGIAIVAIILLIIKAKVDPIIALVLGCLYLGLASGIGFAETVDAITSGFGDIMTKIGLLIGFGVLMGALLHSVGAFKVMVEALVRVVPANRLPYALTVALSTIAPSIYVDVQVVLAAPVARSSAKFLGKNGLAWLAGALGTGIFCGYVFVVPGLSAISIAGLLHVPLGSYLIYGIVIGPVTAVLTTWLFRRMLNRGWWNEAKDEEVSNAEEIEEAADEVSPERRPSLALCLAPIVVPLLMIATGALCELAGIDNAIIAFLGDANIALFLGLVGAYVMARRYVGTARTATAFSEGLQTTGEILLVTGVGGSLGAVIKATGLAKLLGGLFSVDAGAPIIASILLAWFIAALLHLAIGSVSVAAITAAGIVAPILDQIAVSPVVMGLAIASGSLFALQVNSNFFWMFKSLLGLSTQGSLKTMTTVTSMASLISLPLVMAASLVAH